MKVFLYILFIFIFTGAAFASVGPNSKVIKLYFQDAPKMGSGTVYKFVIPAYDITLWSRQKPWSYDTTFALEVKCRWDASQKEMVESTLEAMQRNSALTPTQIKSYTENLYSFYPDLKEKDTITVVYIPHEKICFYHNEKLLKEFKDMTFAKDFCNIWLHPDTKYRSARQNMLGIL